MSLFGKKKTKIDQWLGVTFSLMTATALLLIVFFSRDIVYSSFNPAQNTWNSNKLHCIAFFWQASSAINFKLVFDFVSYKA